MVSGYATSMFSLSSFSTVRTLVGFALWGLLVMRIKWKEHISAPLILEIIIEKIRVISIYYYQAVYSYIL